LRIYTTTTPTTNRLYTLMHDPVYRMSVASENAGYNQPPEPGIYIGDQMTLPQAKPDIRYYDGTSVSSDVASQAFSGPVMVNAVFKAMGNKSLALPMGFLGKIKVVEVFTCSGKLAKRAIVKGNEINLARDFGLSNEAYILTVRAAGRGVGL